MFDEIPRETAKVQYDENECIKAVRVNVFGQEMQWRVWQVEYASSRSHYKGLRQMKAE